MKRASWPPPTRAHQSPPSSSSVAPSGRPSSASTSPNTVRVPHRAELGVIGIAVVLRGRVADDERHRAAEHADGRPVGVGDIRVEQAPSIVRRVPPRGAFGLLHVEGAGDQIARQVGAGVVGALARGLPDTALTSAVVPASGSTRWRPSFRHAMSAAILGGHDARRHGGESERMELCVLADEPVQSLRGAVDEVEAVRPFVPDEGYAPAEGEGAPTRSIRTDATYWLTLAW